MEIDTEIGDGCSRGLAAILAAQPLPIGGAARGQGAIPANARARRDVRHLRENVLCAPRDTLATSSRAGLIAAARAALAAERASRQVVICSEAAWVATALRDAGLESLTDSEARELRAESALIAKARLDPGDGEVADGEVDSKGASRNGDVCPPDVLKRGSRDEVIRASKDAYRAAGPAARRTCSEQAWVSQALREAGRPLLTEDDLGEYSIATE